MATTAPTAAARLVPALLLLALAPAALAAQDAPKLEDVAKSAADNTVAINFVWTLVAGFLVMFMQAGFAMVETGFTRAKNAGHTITMNFMVYGIGMLAYWAVGFALQAGGVGALGTLGGFDQLNHEVVINLFGKPFGLFGTTGFVSRRTSTTRRRTWIGCSPASAAGAERRPGGGVDH